MLEQILQYSFRITVAPLTIYLHENKNVVNSYIATAKLANNVRNKSEKSVISISSTSPIYRQLFFFVHKQNIYEDGIKYADASACSQTQIPTKKVSIFEIVDESDRINSHGFIVKDVRNMNIHFRSFLTNTMRVRVSRAEIIHYDNTQNNNNKRRKNRFIRKTL